ncbi:hypothetical protein [Noviherbaspirillum sp. UKPF54]|uniref:hypothetical protein n=1 Tax=Noviherbaspirillum sp. UKPF54 TaxID=2601898 RepID=UPI0011B152F0|nr:hypothetical protein [Noviherbaspirillum sp. UKPF54]QDZ29976.1 hypothetical protein FAY22_19620 [Noviherbaspirillum sp. UKPF54]
MEKRLLAGACLFAAILAACGGGGGDAPADAKTSTEPTSTVAPAEFATRATRQGDERVYEIVERYSDNATLTYTRRMVQTMLNADRSGERQTFDDNNTLLQSLRYDAQGIRSVTYYPSGFTCSPNVVLNSFPDTLRIGQAIENKYTDSCSNGYAFNTEEAATVAAAEQIDVRGITYKAVKETATVSIERTAPGENFKYAVSESIWIDPVLGLTVKETVNFSYPVPPAGTYLVASTRSLVNYVNK